MLSLVPAILAVSWATSLILLSVCAVTDLRDRIIPNELVAGIAMIGLAQSLLTRPGQAWLSLLIASLVFLGLGVLSHFKFIGGGDTKLISAVTFMVPPQDTGQLLTGIVLAGGLLSCLYLAARGLLRSQGTALPPMPQTGQSSSGLAFVVQKERARIISGGSLPYAVAVLGGAGFFIARGLLQCFYGMSCSL
ncbi:MAG TPA: A24 family peptidase [Methylocella sp.]|nr:A24 family peptidase [Methylocella sp.]